MSIISENIASLRKANNMSQEILAEKLGVSRQAVSKWERDESLPDIYNLNALARVFDVSLDRLVNGEDITISSDVVQSKIGEELKRKANLLLIIAIVFFMMAPLYLIMVYTNESIANLQSTSLLVFFIMITIGVVLSIRYSQLEKDYKAGGYQVGTPKQKKPYSTITRVSSFTSTLAVIIFLLLGFLYGLWHPGWLVFLLTPLVTALVAIFRPKQD